MNETLNDLFRQADWGPIVYNGRTTLRSYKRTVSAKSVISVERIRASLDVTQALSIHASKPVLEINGLRLKKMILWTDTSPGDDEIIVGGRGEAKITVWNSWRRINNGHEGTDAWLTNSGMQITEEGNSVLLECSDGVGEVDFSDLVVRLTFTEPH